MLMRPKIIIPVIVLAIAGGSVAAIISTQNNVEYKTLTVSQQYISQGVDISGTVVPTYRADLAFEHMGRVASIQAKVGSQVQEGDILATLDNTELKTQLTSKQASRTRYISQLAEQRAIKDSEQAKLNELLRGARVEEITLAQTKVANAKNTEYDAKADLSSTKSKATVDLNNIYDNTEDITNDAFTKVDNAINQQIDSLFEDDNTLDPELSFTVSNSDAKDNAEKQRVEAGYALNRLSNWTTITTTEHEALDTILANTESDLKIVRSFLNTLTLAVNSAINLSQATRDDYHNKINIARNNINTELSDVNTQLQKISAQKAINETNIVTKTVALTTAKNATLIAQNELDLLLSGTPQEQLDAQKARVNQAMSAIASQEALIVQTDAEIVNINTQIAQTIMKSPFTGTITVIDIEVGETVALNTPVITLISGLDLEVDANIPEIYIASISVGDPAYITLDAYGENEFFDARITAIDPAETIVGGVPTYTTTFEFTKLDPRIKPGMTATISITVKESFNALTIPASALQFTENGAEVMVLEDGKIVPRSVTTGIRSIDGNIEILTGVEMGNEIIIP